MHESLLSRRAVLLGSAAALGCSHRKATGFRGFCFVANYGGRSVGVVDLVRFRVRKQIPLEAAPGQVIAHPGQPKMLVLAPDAGTVFEIDAVKLEVTRRARVGNTAVAMQLSPANDAVWVLSRDPSALVEVPLASLRPERRIHLASPSDSFDVA